MEDVLITARAPGKIILSGEHSVVYGRPALAMAVNYFAKTTITEHPGYGVWFEFLNNNFKKVVTLEELKNLKKNILKRYRKFLNGKISIKNVLENPLELIQYAFIYLVENLFLPINHGLKVQISLDMPVGSGMGASSSAILSLMHALVNYFHHDLTIDKYLYFGREIENLQHGRSSGLDLFLSLNGGCCFFCDGNTSKRAIPNIPLLLVNTGSPESSTGECVEKVAKYMQEGPLLDEFSEATIAMDNSLQQNNLDGLQTCVKKNNDLLKNIGVVPKKVANFIAEVEEKNNAAKISGAGSIMGDNAGIVLVIGENDISEIVKKYGYEVLLAKGEDSGLSLV